MGKYFKKKEKIDLNKRNFIKKGILAVAAGTTFGLISKIPAVSAWSIFNKTEFKDYSETTISANTGTSYTIDLSNGNVFNLTLTGNCTFTFSNAPVSGKAGSFTLILIQDGTGTRTATWPSSVKWAGGIAPTLTTTATGVDILTFITVDGGTTWRSFTAGLDMK